MTNVEKSLVKSIAVFITVLCAIVIFSSIASINANLNIIVSRTNEEISELQHCVRTNKEVKPSYEELKSHSVVILGCADSEIEQEEEEDSKYTYPLEKNGVCWLGSGSVIKVTKESTYILTNKHVVGFWTVNPIIYIENGEQKIQAEIVKNQPIARYGSY
jgi:S1-C subfamily serine protease